MQVISIQSFQYVNYLNLRLFYVAGELDDARSRRKLEQIQSLLRFIHYEIEVLEVSTERPLTIVEFGGGSGHVALLVAYLYPRHRVILCERKEYCIQIANQRIHQSGLSNISIMQEEITSRWSIPFDLGITLHSCGVLTDISLSISQSHHASFVIVPCCYGQLVKPPKEYIFVDDVEHTKQHMELYRSQSLFHRFSESLYKDIVLMADISHQPLLDNSEEIQSLDYNIGRTCMNIVDIDRLLHLAELQVERGIEVGLSHLEPWTCSPKNNVLYGHFL